MTNKSQELSRFIRELGKIIEPDYGDESIDTFKERKNYTFEGMKRVMRKNRQIVGKNHKNIGVMNKSNTVMVVPKNEFTFQILYTLFRPFEDGWLFAPDLDMMTYKDKIADSRFCVEYVEQITQVFKSIGEETIQIQMSKDYPGIFMTSKNSENMINFEIIVAPRVDDE